MRRSFWQSAWGRLLKVWLGFWLVFWLGAVAILQFWILPNLDDFRPTLLHYLRAQTGKDLSIAALSGRWDGWHTRLDLHDVELREGDAPPLRLARLSLLPAWSSLWRFRLEFAELQMLRPSLSLRRDAKQRLWLNGVLLGEGDDGDGKFGRWILAQHQVRVDDAALSFLDEALGLPKAQISGGQILLKRDFWGDHALHIRGKISENWGQFADLQMYWRGTPDPNAWASWQGDLRFEVGGMRLSPAAAYLGKSTAAGELGLKLRLQFTKAKIDSLALSGDLRDFVLQQRASPPLKLPKIAGDLQLRRQQKHGQEIYILQAKNLDFHTEEAKLLDRGDISGRWQVGKNLSDASGELRFRDMDLSALPSILRQLPWEENQPLRDLAPAGFVKDLQLAWQGDLRAPRQFSLLGDFERLSWTGVNAFPAASGLAGRIELNERGGRLQLRNFGQARLDFPAMFAQPLLWNDLALDIRAEKLGELWRIHLSDFQLKNPLLSGKLAGRIDLPAAGAPQVDLTGEFAHLDAAILALYLPHGIEANARAWLSQALRGGALRDLTWQLAGDPRRFPFAQGGGQFQLHGKLAQLGFSFSEAWPKLAEIDGDFWLNNAAVELKLAHAKTKNVALENVHLHVPNLTAEDLHLKLAGEAAGETAAIFDYLAASPLENILGGLPSKVRAQGKGKLHLALDIPIFSPANLQVRGRYRFENNDLALDNLGMTLPTLQALRGEIVFSEQGASSPRLDFAWLGGAARLHSQEQASGGQIWHLKGRAQGLALLDFLPKEARRALQTYARGALAYRAALTLKQGVSSLSVAADWQSRDLPEFLREQVGERLPLRIDYAAKTGELSAHLGELLQARLAFSGGQFRAARAHLGKPMPLPLPSRGVHISARGDRVIFDDVLAFVGDVLADNPNLSAGKKSNFAKAPQADVSSARFFPLQLDLQAQQLELFGAKLGASSLFAHVASPQKARAHWQNAGFAGKAHWQNRRLSLQLARLHYPFWAGEFDAVAWRQALRLQQEKTPKNQKLAPFFAKLPAVDLSARDLRFLGKNLGALQLQAAPCAADFCLKNGVWHVGKAGDFSGGQIRFAGLAKGDASENILQFQALSDDFGAMLANILPPAQHDFFREGRGDIAGELRVKGDLGDVNWRDAANFSGDLRVNVQDGRLAALPVGAAKILAATSLASLPRRWRGNWDDLARQGWTFDRAQADFVLNRGVLTWENAQIFSTMAHLASSGRADLTTQKIDVHAQISPHLAESVAILTALAINPATGLAVLAAQKWLALYRFHFHILGDVAAPEIRWQRRLDDGKT